MYMFINMHLDCHIIISCFLSRFETSYSLLHILLGSPTATPTYEAPSTLLPIVKLWPNLIAAACELTGEQRIKVIGILLQLLLWNSSAQKVEGGGASAGSGTSQRLDLTMLKPLWSLYTTTSKEYGKRRQTLKQLYVHVYYDHTCTCRHIHVHVCVCKYMYALF